MQRLCARLSKLSLSSPHDQDLEVIFTAEVAEYEARDVLFGRVGAIEVGTSVAVENNNCERSPTAMGRSMACGSARPNSMPTCCIQYNSRALLAENKLVLCSTNDQ